MKIGIIADSCCDCTPQLKNVLGLQLAPLKITVPGFGEVIDDENIDTKKLVANMKECKTASSSACPSPEDYAELMRKSEACFVVTLSSKLSGSYQSAIIAKQLVQEQEPNKKVHIVDSESAACGEFRLALALRSWIDEGLDFEKIQENITDLVAKMRTLFVLEDLGNLVKNGRISKAAGLLGGMLGLRPIMGENGHGEIVCLEKIRGTEKALAKLVDTIGDFLGGRNNLTLVMSHCQCMERALALKKVILERYKEITDIIIVPTSGLSTMYANYGGIILAF